MQSMFTHLNSPLNENGLPNSLTCITLRRNDFEIQGLNGAAKNTMEIPIALFYICLFVCQQSRKLMISCLDLDSNNGT